MDARKIFGLNVARLRSSRGLSQVTLALILDPDGKGISQSYLSQLEAGKRDPKLSMLVDLAQALGVAVAELVAGCETADEKTPRRPLRAKSRL